MNCSSLLTIARRSLLLSASLCLLMCFAKFLREPHHNLAKRVIYLRLRPGPLAKLAADMPIRCFAAWLPEKPLDSPKSMPRLLPVLFSLTSGAECEKSIPTNIFCIKLSSTLSTSSGFSISTVTGCFLLISLPGARLSGYASEVALLMVNRTSATEATIAKRRPKRTCSSAPRCELSLRELVANILLVG